MNLDNYLLRGVKPEEFAELKRQEVDLVNSVMEGFNETWKLRVQGIKATFKYNPLRNVIGIYVERQGQQQLVVEGRGLRLSVEEDVVVGSLYQRIEQKLDRLRLLKEEWVDSVSN